MYLYIFVDSVTGEKQQPFLAHNDNEAVRIARMAFQNVPRQILPDLCLDSVVSYDDEVFTTSPIYSGSDFIHEIDSDNE